MKSINQVKPGLCIRLGVKYLSIKKEYWKYKQTFVESPPTTRQHLISFTN